MKKILKYTFTTIAVLLVLAAAYFFLVKKLDNDTIASDSFYSAAHTAKVPVLLPSLFMHGERFYIKVPTTNGDTLLAFGDTGGGVSMLLPAVVDKMGVRGHVKTGILKGVMPMKYVPFNDIVKDASIPAPVQFAGMILRRPFSHVSEPFLLIPPMDEELKFMTKSMSLDMFLGQNFFMGKAWTFDYPRQQVWVNTPIAVSEQGKPGVQRMGFKKDEHDHKLFGHPSIVMKVDGETIYVLFDTGATIVLSEKGKKVFGTTEATKGGSFIAASLFDKWRKLHPDWRYYDKVDMNRDVIEVPVVEVGGYAVGPVLFAKRDGKAWSEGMINSMDKVVKGAIGGSALKYLKVTIDYNSELIRFEQ